MYPVSSGVISSQASANPRTGCILGTLTPPHCRAASAAIRLHRPAQVGCTLAPRISLRAHSTGMISLAPSSVAFCHRVKMDYVSCSPYRVPIARLAAAHAALADKKK